MAVDTVSSTTPANPNSSLGISDFLKILSTQLSYQDPLKPMDNTEFLAQIAQFTSLEQSQEMNTKMGEILANQSAFQSISLIGKNVDITTSNGIVPGVVSSLSLSGSSPLFTVTPSDGSPVLGNVSLSQITTVN